jgi:hypothetical protein
MPTMVITPSSGIDVTRSFSCASKSFYTAKIKEAIPSSDWLYIDSVITEFAITSFSTLITYYYTNQVVKTFDDDDMYNAFESLSIHIGFSEAVNIVSILERCFPPASRLVGIELNPGPKNPVGMGTLALSAASIAAQAVADTVFPTNKKSTKKNNTPNPTKKKQGKAKKKKNQMKVASSVHTSSVTAPMRRDQIMSSSGLSHKPFQVTTNSLVLTLSLPASSGRCFITSNGVDTAASVVNLSPASVSSSSYIAQSFSTPLTNIARQFTRYRCNRLHVSFISYVPTTVYGAVFLGYVPDGSVNTNAFTFADIASLDTFVTGPLYTPIGFEVPKRHLGEWLYTSPNVASEADEKFAFFGSLVTQVTGCTYTTSIQALGYFLLEGDFEFDNLGVNTTFGSTKFPSIPVPEKEPEEEKICSYP